jgi:hypothetical protein
MPGVAMVCAEHPNAEADFQCGNCATLLCSRCVSAAGSLYICGRCGERSFPLDHYEEPDPFAASRPAVERAPLESFASLIAHHWVVPLAIMAMVGGFLFFLVDVRSVHLPLGFALKWVGFCFVVATVLTARYGRWGAAARRRDTYSVLLGLAMLLVLWAAPWNPNSNFLIFLVNAALIFVVWLFAFKVTTRLSREGERIGPRKRKLYGVERLELKAWREEHESPVGSLKGKQDAEDEKKEKAARSGDKSHSDAHGNPSAGVAGLAALALVVIALCEPLLLAGAPEIGVRALASVLVFLLGTGLVLSAGSAVGALRTVREQGGQVSETVVPWRLAVALVLTVGALSLALAVPGVTYRGRGEIIQDRIPGDHTGILQDESADGSGSGKADLEGEGGQEAGQEAGTEAGESKSAEYQGKDGGDQGQDGESSESSNPASIAAALLAAVAGIGKFLWIPFALLLIFGGFWLLQRLGPYLWAQRGLLSGWRAKLLELLAGLARAPQRGAGGPRRKVLRPIDFGALGRMAPSAAVVESYLCLLDRLEALGYERPQHHAPYEYVNGLPRHVVHLEKPLVGITELYVQAAYGGAVLAEADRKAALQTLRAVDASL